VPSQRSTNERGAQLQSWPADPIKAQELAAPQDSRPKFHEAAVSMKPVASGASADHVFPFQRAEEIPVIATHEVGETRETGPAIPDSRRVPGIGDQRNPFHASASEPTRRTPSATQNRRETHDRSSPTPRIRIDHVEPFQVPRRSDWSPASEEE
jgi:hypothetical protein